MNREPLARRLFSLAGVFPLGLFLLEHFATNASALAGAATFGRVVRRILTLPGVLAVEVLGIWIPLAFHAGYGLYFVARRLPFREPSPYSPRMRAVLRGAGVVALVYVLFHLYEYRFGAAGLGERGELLYSRLAERLSSLTWGIPWRACGYVLGIGAVVLHFVGGLWGYLVGGGIVRSENGPRRAAWALTALGAVMFAVAVSLVVSFATGAHPFFVPIDRGPNATTPCPSPPLK